MEVSVHKMILVAVLEVQETHLVPVVVVLAERREEDRGEQESGGPPQREISSLVAGGHAFFSYVYVRKFLRSNFTKANSNLSWDSVTTVHML